MLIRTMKGALARGDEIEVPNMNFRQMTLGWQQDSSFVARLLATRALWAEPDTVAVPSEGTEG